MKQEVGAVEKRTCLLVLGMHRSGTSAMTRVLNIAGAKLPATLMGASDSSNATGHWEPDALIQYHDRLLAELGSSWDDWQALNIDTLPVKRRGEIRQEIGEIIAADFGGASLFVLKDPRICRFAPFFLDLLQETGFEVSPVLMFRNPLEVCESLERRDSMSRADAALLWLRHVLDAESSTRNHKRAIVSYNHLLIDWKAGFANLIKQTGLKDFYAIDEIEPQVEEFLSADYRHHKRKTADVLLDPLLRNWVGAAYDALLVLVRNPWSKKAMDRLDAIAGEFNNASPVLRKLYDTVRSERTGEIDDLSAKLSEREGEISDFKEALFASQSKETELETSLAQAQGEASQLEATLAQRSAEIEELKKAGDVREREIDALNARLAEQNSEIDGFKQALSAAEGKEAELEVSLAQAQGEAGQLEATLAQRSAEIEELKKSLAEREAKTLELAAKQKEAQDKNTELKNALIAQKRLTTGAKSSLTKLKKKTELLSAKQKEAESKEAELEGRLKHAQGEAGQLEATFAQRGEEITELKKSLGEQEARSASLKVKFNETEGKNAELAARLAEREQETASLREALIEAEARQHSLEEDSTKENQALAGEVQEKAAFLETARARIADLEQQLSGAHRHAQDIEQIFRNSISWKLTWPLRAIAKPFKNIKKKPAQIASAFRTIKHGIALGGGLIPTIGKAVRIYRQERLAGLRERVKYVVLLTNDKNEGVGLSVVNSASWRVMRLLRAIKLFFVGAGTNLIVVGADKNRQSESRNSELQDLKRERNEIIESGVPQVGRYESDDIERRNVMPRDSLVEVLWVINSHDKSTQRYRVFNLIEVLRESGVTSVVASDRALEDIDLSSTSLVVLNRIGWSQTLKKFFQKAKKYNIPVIFDIDDMVFDPSTLHLLRAHSVPEKRGPMSYAMNAWRETMRNCDYVTVSTEALLLIAHQKGARPFVIPNNIPKGLIDKITAKSGILKKKRNHVYIGYFSGTSTHLVDFEECADAVYKVLKLYEYASFVLVGEYEKSERFNNFGDRFIYIPLQNYENMLRLVADMDIVLAPLELNNAFTDCKSQLKVFEAAAFGVPCVASPVRSYLSYVKDGVSGYLAATPDEWEGKLSKLIESSQLRMCMGEQATKTILPAFLSSSVGLLAEQTYRHIIREFKTKETHRHVRSTTKEKGIAKVKKRPAISIVAPLYNKMNEVEYFLDSIYFQDTDELIEVILIDDLCPQASGDVAKKYVERLEQSSVRSNVDVIILRNEKNLGNCSSRNRGLREACAPIVMVVDADCLFDHGVVACHLAAHYSESCDVAVGLRGIETESDHPLHRLGLMRVDPDRARRAARFQDSIVPGSFVNCVTRNLSFNRKKYSKLFFDEEFSYTRNPKSGFGWEDVEFGYRLYLKGARIKFLNDNISLHVTHEYDLQNPEKPKRSLRNYARLFVKHPELPSTSPAWSRHTFTAITRWLEKFDHPVKKLQDWSVVDKALADIPKKIYRSPDRPLRVLTHRWHCAHQFELYRLGHKFDLVRSAGTTMCDNWEWRHRPMPENARFVEFEAIHPNEYDLAIIHFDENIIHPERCHGHVPTDWGRTAKAILQYSNDIPTVAICHGTPQFSGQYDINFNGETLGRIDEQSREEVVRLFEGVTVICNSHQAKDEWKFGNSRVIWHGFSASDFPFGQGSGNVLAMEERKLRQRPHYNGWFEYEGVVKQLTKDLLPTTLEMGALDEQFRTDPIVGSEKRFFRYARELGKHDIYLNTTLRSPMPRMRGEAMMAGCIPISLNNHDVNMFIENGKNGFFSNSVEELADGIKFIMSNDVAREKMRGMARNVALSKFSLDRYLREWSQVIDEVLR